MRPSGTWSAAKVAAVSVALALLAWLVALQHAVGPARVVAGLLLVFVLPGVAAYTALFPVDGPTEPSGPAGGGGRSGLANDRGGSGPAGDRPERSKLERIVLIPVLSLAVPVIGGVLVNATGLRLDAGTWGGLGFVATLLLAGVGYARARRHSRQPQGNWPSENWQPSENWPPAPWEPPPPEASQKARFWRAAARTAPGRAASRTTTQVLGDPATTQVVAAPADRPTGRVGGTARRLAPLAVAVALLGVAAWIGLHSATTQGQEAFTALSMVPDDDPNASDQVRPVTIAVDCHEATPTRYTVKVQEGASVGPQYQISLQPGQVWKQDLNVPITGRTTADLFKGDGTTPYRTVFVSELQ